MVEEPLEDRARPVFDMGKFTMIWILSLSFEQKRGKIGQKIGQIGHVGRNGKKISNIRKS